MTDASPPQPSRLLVAGLAGGFALLAVALVGVVEAPVTARDDSWREVVERAVRAGEADYAGEALVVFHHVDRMYTATLSVAHVARQGLVVRSSEGMTARFARDSGRLAHEEHGWAVPLPGLDLLAGDDALVPLLERKYVVRMAGGDHVIGRPCTALEVRRRGGDVLRERLCFDDASGLLVRRETYAGEDRLVRMVAFVHLELEPPGSIEDEWPSDDGGEALVQHAHGVAVVEAHELEVLRRAGWIVPRELPQGYQPVGTYAMAMEGSQPLHVVYSDGLYTVSVFQQAGRPDWSTLPPGAEQADGFGGRVYEWPGAVPHRLVWEQDGRTWSVVGDAPEEELREIVDALPQASEVGAWERVRRGFGRLWSRVSPWR